MSVFLYSSEKVNCRISSMWFSILSFGVFVALFKIVDIILFIINGEISEHSWAIIALSCLSSIVVQ